MLTRRDFEIIEFLEVYKIATTTVLQYFFFPSLSSCQKRLLKLVQSKQVKRVRDNVNSEYIYYIKKPKQINHSLKVSELYMELSKKYEIKHFKIEVNLGSIRPDAVFGYIENGKSKIGMLEVELSNKEFNQNKYINFIQNGDAKDNGISKFSLYVWKKTRGNMDVVELPL